MYEFNAVTLGAYVTLDVICLLLIIVSGIVAHVFDKNTGRPHSALLTTLVVLVGLYFCTDIIWAVGEYLKLAELIVFDYAINAIYFICLAAAAGIWLCNTVNYFRMSPALKKILYAAIAIPVAVVAFFCVTAYGNNLLFFIDESFEYERGPLFALFGFVNYGYIGIAALLSLIIASKRKPGHRTYYYISATCSAPIMMFAFFQIFLPFNFTCIGYTISIMIYFVYYMIRGINIEKGKYEDNVIKAGAEADEAKAASNAKTVFLFNMSHDIRTPMNAILGYTRLAKKANCDPQVEDYLNKIDVSGQQLLSLINQVLEMSRIESGKVTLSEEPADVTERSKAMETVSAADVNLKGVSYKLVIGKIEHKNVLTDVSRVNQIIGNIVGNAVKYTPKGGTVTCTIEEKDCDRPGYGLYVVTVSDTGIGMSEEYLSRIFEEFSRENTSTVSKIQGTGLGMSIVKRLVDLMDGKIEIRSKQGKGTTVTVSLPMKWNDGEVETKDDEIVAFTSFDGMKVLLVEDNDMNREIAACLLDDYGIKVTEADDGDTAVEIVRNSKPGDIDVILMDVQMPRMDGYEATKHIRELEDRALAELPIIAMTANAFEEDRQNALKAGMNGHLAKPIDVRSIMLTLSKYKKHTV